MQSGLQRSASLEAVRMRFLGFLALALALYGCSLERPVLREEIADLGRLEFREAEGGLEGVVIGAPHSGTDPLSDRVARAISDRTGAGLVAAYGFKSKGLGVSQPLVSYEPYASLIAPRRGSIFADYRKILHRAAKGRLDLYVGVHRSAEKELAGRIEVATSGLTFEEARVLKEAYYRIRDEASMGKEASKLEMLIEPLDGVSWRVSGEKHHGVLMVAAKGLNIRVPGPLSPESDETLYTEILARWVGKAISLLRENPLRLPQVQVKLMELGRLEMVRAHGRPDGIVIGAPHGSFDEYTAEMVKRLSFQTGAAAVIAKGFTPTETMGMRINVNRPTEKLPYSEGAELHSRRAKETYRAFKDMVLEASGGDLKLYIDIHQYGTGKYIQVATVGISRKEAWMIKTLYREIRDKILQGRSKTPAVDLLIEPFEAVEIGAWAAKSEGILGLAAKALHFELPRDEVLGTSKSRDAYVRILSSLLQKAAPLLLSGRTAGT